MCSGINLTALDFCSKPALIMKSFPYSELEKFVLAMIGAGVTSGYAMRKLMLRRPGSRWSAESGSIYRTLRRLQDQDLITLLGKAGNPNRARSEYQLTNLGTQVVQHWLTSPPEQSELGHLADSMRTRGYFLELLEPEARIEVVATWMIQSDAYLKELRRSIKDEPMDTELRNMVVQNLLFLATARHEWLVRLHEFVRNQHLGVPDQKVPPVTE